MVEAVIVFPADHPALAGHFPGNPIVPGACLLDRAATLAGEQGGWRVTGIRRAKFRTPLRPGVECRFRLERRGEGLLALTCLAGPDVVMEAVLDHAAEDTPR